MEIVFYLTDVEILLLFALSLECLAFVSAILVTWLLKITSSLVTDDKEDQNKQVAGTPESGFETGSQDPPELVSQESGSPTRRLRAIVGQVGRSNHSSFGELELEQDEAIHIPIPTTPERNRGGNSSLPEAPFPPFPPFVLPRSSKRIQEMKAKMENSRLASMELIDAINSPIPSTPERVPHVNHDSPEASIVPLVFPRFLKRLKE